MFDVPQRLRQKYPELPLEMRTNEGQQWDLEGLVLWQP
jgi:hypothetical protein